MKLHPLSRFSLALLVTLAGCGKSGHPGGQPAAPTTTGATASTTAQAEVPALDCPARIKTNVSGPDINGLKLGMTRDEALALARCSQKTGMVANEPRFFSQLNTGALKLGPQQFTVQSGETAECKFTSFSDSQACGLGNRVWKRIDETVTVATPGLPGHETAVGIWRTQHYPAGSQPTVETAKQALIAKYGAAQLTQKYDGSNGWVQLYWLNDPAGQPISEQNPLIRNCPSIQARGDADQSWSEACGLTIAAMLTLAPSNPLLVAELSVGMVDQAKLYAYGTAMQNEIAALEQQRKLGEAKAAQDTAVAPKL